MNKIQEYIDLGYVRRTKHPTLNLWIYNYTIKCETESKWDDTTLQCRGLVLDDSHKRINRPFNKFFNIEQAEYKYPNIPYVIFEKIDGSFIQVFKYKSELIVTSKGSFTSEQAIKAREIISKHNPKIEDNTTYLFEIIYPENRIVIDYGKEESLILLSIHDTMPVISNAIIDNHAWLIEKIREFASTYNFKMPLAINSTIKELLEEKKRTDFINKEGYVVYFTNGYKLKIKYERYFELHKIMTDITSKDILLAITNGDSIIKFCEDKDVPDEMLNDIKKIESEFRKEIVNIEQLALELYKQIPVSTEQKDTALWIVSNSPNKLIQSILFAMIKDKEYSVIIYRSLINKEKENRVYIGRKDENRI